MDDPPAQADGEDIKTDSGASAYEQGYLIEKYLGHRIKGRDIEHVCLSMGGDINNRSKCEKHCQQWQCFCVFPPAFSGKTAPVAVKTDEDQDQVPGQSVNGQCHVRLHQPGWFCQCHDASQKRKILKLGAEGAGDRTAFMHKN